MVSLVSEMGVLSADNVTMVGTILVPSKDGSMTKYLGSLERLKALKPRLLFPSHGPVCASPDRLLGRTINHRKQRHEGILKVIQSGVHSLAEIAMEAYQDSPNAPVALSRDQALSHINGLIEQRLVIESDDGYRPKSTVGQGSSLLRSSGPIWMALQSHYWPVQLFWDSPFNHSFWGIGLYNRIVRKENRVEQSWSNVDVVLNNDMISLPASLRQYQDMQSTKRTFSCNLQMYEWPPLAHQKAATSEVFLRTKPIGTDATKNLMPLQNSTQTSKQMSPSSSSKIKLVKSRI